ncbi:MAG: polysaccharide export protein [Bacteroidales bacterium]|nr:polysaccharide export protein [Bacteroidales bacterium]
MKFDQNPKGLLTRSLIPFFTVLLIVSAVSCVHTKETTYLQQYDDKENLFAYTPPSDYLIQTNDNLYIRISTPDPQWSAIFNPESSGVGMGMSEAAIQLSSYSVQPNGTIDLPYIGLVEVRGLTINEVKEVIESELRDYVRDPSLIVRLVNNNIAILGEVEAPGLYPVYKDRLNIFQALAMAGDISEFGDRYRVAIIRQGEDTSDIVEFDLTDRNIIDSEYYYVQPNDVLYVKPKKGRYFSINSFPWTFVLSSITATLSLFILVQNLIYIQQN